MSVYVSEDDGPWRDCELEAWATLREALKQEAS